ncbi:MAG: response regulator transcription factor [Christensenellales bacterium]|jgi:two-component system response regulator YesN
MNRYKAIIVDDDPWTLIDIRACFPFEANGFTVVAECGSAEAALPIILAHRPELVITDIRMERGSGLELIRACRERGLMNLFIILSGYDTFEYAQEAVELGAFRYMLKPISDSEAQQVMQQAAARVAGMKERGKDEPEEPTDEGDTFERIIGYLERHSAENITLDKLSRTFYINRTYICDLFRKRTGKTFTEHLSDIRVRKACFLLKNTTLAISTVALRVGFDDARYFSRVFKSIMGMTPFEYRIANREHA